MLCHLSCSYTVGPRYIFVAIVSVTVVLDNISIHSLTENSIGDKGAVAISEAIKTMTDLQELA